MKTKFLKLSRLFILIIASLILSCESDENPLDAPVGGDVYRMQVVEIDLPNTSLTSTEYIGTIGSENVTLLKGDDHQLWFMVPTTLALGKQELTISDLNNLKVTYNIKAVELPDSPDAVISSFQNNLNTFQATPFGNPETQNAINSFNQVYQNSSEEEKIEFASLYHINKELFDAIILNDFSNLSGKNSEAANEALFKYKAAIVIMTASALVVVYGTTPIEKISGAVLMVVAGCKSVDFGRDFAEQKINTVTVKMNEITGVNNRNSLLSGVLELQNDEDQTVPFNTVDRTVIAADATKENSSTKLFFTNLIKYNGLVNQVNPILEWINTNIPFTNFDLIPVQVVPSTSATTINPINTQTYNSVSLSINNPNLSLVSTSLASEGQLKIKVKIVGTTETTVEGFINYSFNDEFSTFSGKIPVRVSSDTENVTIGTQVWMRKNLDVSTYRNGDPIPQVQDPTEWINLTTGAWCYYENNSGNGPIYGKLYNWYAVNDPRGLAPEGYHIPSDDEWIILTNFLGGENIAGGKMKSIGTLEAGTGLWEDPNEYATNESGFTGVPGGYVGDFGSVALGWQGCWWSSSGVNSSNAWCRRLFYGNNEAFRDSFEKYYGMSIRCLKD